MEILSLGEKIKKIRKERNMTLKELAGDRVTAAQISHIERDKSHTSYELLEYLSQKLDVSIDYLIETREMQVKNILDNLLLQSEVFIKYEDLDSAEERISKAFKLSKQYELVEIYGTCNSFLGDINEKRKKYDDAILNYENALDFFSKNNMYSEIFRTHVKIGKIYLKQNLFKMAIVKFEIAGNFLNKMEFEKKVNDYKELYTNMSFCYSKLDNKEQCIEYIKKIDKIIKIYDSREELEANLNKAKNLFESKNLEESSIYFRKALNFLNKHEDDKKKAQNYINIANICKEINDIDRMLDYSQKVYEIKKDDNDEYMIKSLCNIIESYILKEDYDEAKKYCKIGITISIKNKDKINECVILKLYARLYKELQEVDLAMQYLSKCLDIAREIDNKKLIGDIYIELAEMYSETSKEKQLEFYQKGASIYKSLGNI